MRGKSVLRPNKVGSRLVDAKVAMTSDRVVSGLVLPFCGKRPFGLFWMRGTACVCVKPPRSGMSHGGTGLKASSSFFLLKNEPMVLRELARFGPRIPVETVKACALIGSAHAGLEVQVTFRRILAPAGGPALQQFPVERPRLVGLWEKRA